LAVTGISKVHSPLPVFQHHRLPGLSFIYVDVREEGY